MKVKVIMYTHSLTSGWDCSDLSVSNGPSAPYI